MFEQLKLYSLEALLKEEERDRAAQFCGVNSVPRYINLNITSI